MKSSAKVQLNQAGLTTLRGNVRRRVVNVALMGLLLLTSSPKGNFEALEFDSDFLQQLLGCGNSNVHTLLSVESHLFWQGTR
jgi:hypothetical protein